ncbi:DUF2157 domain-containing protein [Propionivibrio limicola]|uniref:DUF2157 domain-containing protein n=1 Tax=Propionivibrio limicola TaxID=167645 RepID=UPI0012923EBC|nr:DUF2157 domain-containing protein [Propionivibrio limicola]
MGQSSLRRYLQSLAHSGQLSSTGLEIGLQRCGVLPDAERWHRFVDRLLLGGGALLILAGIIFFFAFNWTGLHRFQKMALVSLPLIVAASRAVLVGVDRAEGKAWLASGVVLAGVLLAVIGQIYQTGADSELLFAGWAVLTLPWVVAGRAPWLWLFWLVLVNTALTVFLVGRLDVWVFFFFNDAMFWAPLLVNALALALWEALWPRIVWMRAAYAPRLIAAFSAVAGTTLGVSWWFLGSGTHWNAMPYVPLVYVPWLAATFWFYSQHRRDIVPLVFGALSAIVVLTAGLIDGLSDQFWRDGMAAFFMLGISVAAMTAVAAVWLRRVLRHWSEAGMVGVGEKHHA